MSLVFEVTSPEVYARALAQPAMVRDISPGHPGESGGGEWSEQQAFSGGESPGVTDAFPLRKIVVGETEYNLRTVIEVLPTLVDGDQWACCIQGCSELVGRGSSRAEAFKALQEAFHTSFQRLYAMRPFEMSDDDAKLWDYFTGVIDLANYKQDTPIELSEIGTIRFGRRSVPSCIKWVDGRSERIDLDKVPPQMAGYCVGQPFECISLRDALTGALVRIAACWKIPTIPPASVARSRFVSMNTAELPIVDLDLE